MQMVKCVQIPVQLEAIRDINHLYAFRDAMQNTIDHIYKLKASNQASAGVNGRLLMARAIQDKLLLEITLC